MRVAHSTWQSVKKRPWLGHGGKTAGLQPLQRDTEPDSCNTYPNDSRRLHALQRQQAISRRIASTNSRRRHNVSVPVNHDHNSIVFNTANLRAFPHNFDACSRISPPQLLRHSLAVEPRKLREARWRNSVCGAALLCNRSCWCCFRSKSDSGMVRWPAFGFSAASGRWGVRRGGKWRCGRSRQLGLTEVQSWRVHAARRSVGQ